MIDISKKIRQIKKKAQGLEKTLSQPQKLSSKRLAQLSKEQAELSFVIAKIDQWEKIKHEMVDNQEVIGKEPDLAEMAKKENQLLKKKEKGLKEDLIRELITADPQDKRNVILEIRAGTGGEEAELFANDLFRIYQRYSQKQGWQFIISDLKRSPLGGIREVIVEIKGKNVFQYLKYEGGVHRVQRVPKTEKSGRLHTSAATVAVLPEAKPKEIELEEKDLEIATFRSSGPGGQSVNTTDSAVRVTHKPSKISVSCQDEKSQLKNRQKAIKILRARLLAKEEEERQKKQGEERKIMVGTGDRSEKIRTYNFPQNRVTDHRINYTSHNLETILEGNMEELAKRLQETDQKAKLTAIE